MSDIIAYSRMKDRPKAGLLVKATPGAAGWDVVNAASKRLRIDPGCTAILPTGIKMVIPEGYEVQVRSRSGLAANSKVFVLNSPGTIDSDYRGEIGVILANFGKDPFFVEPGVRIAQLVPVKLPDIKLVEQVTLDMFEETERGEKGFGSTGS